MFSHPLEGGVLVSDRPVVLIIDDSETFVMYVAILLRRMGFEVLSAENGFEAIKLASVFKPDIIMLDLIMPGMDGMATLRHIKSTSKLRGVPVVMVTVRADEETRRECMELGCVGFLSKPVRLTELHACLQDNVLFAEKRRRHMRTPLRKKIQVTCNGTPRDFYAITLSEGGVYVRKKDPYPVGTEVFVRLSLQEKSPPLDLSGTVIYTKGVYGDSQKLDPGMAIRFNNPGKKATSLLRDFIAEELVGDIVDEQKTPVIIKDAAPEAAIGDNP